MTAEPAEMVERQGFVPRKQLLLHNPPLSYGDCQRTCLAMVLGLESSEVPHFGDEHLFALDETRAAERAWLASLGLGYVQMPISGQWGWPFVEGLLAQQYGTPVIVSGKSPRGHWNHDVVWLDGVIYDPHPDDTGLEGPCIDKANPDEPRWYWINALCPLPGWLSRRLSPPAGEGGGR
jgi:hypothetical protein